MAYRHLFAIALLLGTGLLHARTLEDGTAAFNEGDFVLAREILTPLAQGPSGDAQYLLARIYADGLGVAADMAKAVHWYEQAVANAHRQAAFTLSKMYLSGHGVPWDTQKGIHYLELANSFPTFELPEECE